MLMRAERERLEREARRNGVGPDTRAPRYSDVVGQEESLAYVRDERESAQRASRRRAANREGTVRSTPRGAAEAALVAAAREITRMANNRLGSAVTRSEGETLMQAAAQIDPGNPTSWARRYFEGAG